ncbi:trigger factor [Suipraeoptans intestinalis]|uniref:peptidylprolyl isomerase n=1 Tax=Suipraeoptans intestinalis TaxID=2606628 RepID=A0A6N7V240_9FIRM|nr:trigger factor [Suipraeoptans intestinalis]MDD7770306.1 trigger factor [Suipraeoptans intestinalis]MDY3121996.1 trigger factor [Suipraeoptans intestinalis]MSR94210.1 trigger factor [Suipraeoptans intestinalis]
MSKKTTTVLLAGMLAGALCLTGCATSKGLETKNLKISKYKGVEVDKVDKPQKVTDEAVDSAIEASLNANATKKEITDRAVENGDTVTIDFVGKIDGEAFEGGSAQDYPLVIGSGSFIPGFEESVIGHKTGETFDWNGTFPDNYTPEYAGKAVTFTITVKGITQNDVPKLTDEVVKTLSKTSKTVKEYKEEVRKNLETEAQSNYDNTLAQKVWDKVLENTKIKSYPKKEVKAFADKFINRYKEMASSYGMEYETMIKEQMNMSVEDFEKEVDKMAKSSLKQTMITEAIAKEEGIKVSGKEYEKQLKALAKNYGYGSVKELKAVAPKEDLEDIVQNKLVKEWLVKHCVQVEKK